MGLFAVDIGALVIVALILFRGGPDRQVGSVRRARLLRMAALAVLALQGLFFLAFAVGEMGGGDAGGAGHLMQVALVVGLCVLLWTRPLETGAVLLAGGLIYTVSLLRSMSGSAPGVPSLGPVIQIWPQVAAGVLALLAGLAARRT